MKAMPAGKPPKFGKVAVVKVEKLDQVTGQPFEPAEFDYWVVSLDSGPTVLQVDNPSFESAYLWGEEYERKFNASPA